MATVWLKKAPKRVAQKKPKKKTKYSNKKITNRFGTFDSEREWSRFKILRTWERVGVITNLRRQVTFELVPGVKLHGETRAKPAIRYVADYVYNNEFGEEVIEDAKGVQDKVYRLKKHLMKALLQKDIVEV